MLGEGGGEEQPPPPLPFTSSKQKTSTWARGRRWKLANFHPGGFLGGPNGITPSPPYYVGPTSARGHLGPSTRGCVGGQGHDGSMCSAKYATHVVYV